MPCVTIRGRSGDLSGYDLNAVLIRVSRFMFYVFIHLSLILLIKAFAVELKNKNWQINDTKFRTLVPPFGGERGVTREGDTRVLKVRQFPFSQAACLEQGVWFIGAAIGDEILYSIFRPRVSLSCAFKCAAVSSVPLLPNPTSYTDSSNHN